MCLKKGRVKKIKFYEFIEYLKKENPYTVVMVKSGAFFNAIGSDAIVLEKVLGFKLTCHAKYLCKCGMPVSYVRENIEKVKERLKEKNISIIIYDEIKGGRYKYKEKEYDVIFEIKGKSIYESRKNLGCKNCKNNIYSKETNKYTLEKERYENTIKRLKEKINKIIKNKTKI